VVSITNTSGGRREPIGLISGRHRLRRLSGSRGSFNNRGSSSRRVGLRAVARFFVVQKTQRSPLPVCSSAHTPVVKNAAERLACHPT
jgi:hypothetical protein